jgi:hypothetical protein
MLTCGCTAIGGTSDRCWPLATLGRVTRGARARLGMEDFVLGGRGGGPAIHRCGRLGDGPGGVGFVGVNGS